MKKAEQRQASPRDLMSDQEVVRCAGDLGFVLRERVYDIREDGSKGSERFIRYTAWEPIAIGSAYAVSSVLGPDAKPWGRVDTKRSSERMLVASDAGWLAQQSRLRQHEMLEQARARKMIVDTCQETSDGYFGPEGIKLALMRGANLEIEKLDYRRSPPGAATWADYKLRNDPPGMSWWCHVADGLSGRTLAWTWYDRRLALSLRLRREAHWPHMLRWSDDQVAQVERWLDSVVTIATVPVAEIPEVLRG